MHTGIWYGHMRNGDHLEHPGRVGRIILKWIFKKWYAGMDWIDLVQDRDRWRTLVKCGNETSVSIKCGEFLV
jgi:hypothetical protein